MEEQILDNLTSLDLYLNFPAKKIIKTYCIEDVACAIYPCFYIECNDYLKVSSSAVELIKESKELVLNKKFKPNFFMKSWYEGPQTIDKRIKRLKAFEIKKVGSSKINFKSEKTLKDKDEYIEKSVFYFKKFVNYIERSFPEHDHVVFTGGKDSQLVHLVPKLNEDKWHVFSSHPSVALIKKWLTENDVKYGQFFEHDNINNENKDFVMEKVLNSDMICSPEHIRWSKSIIDISNKFNKKCIFWTGTIGDTFYNCHIYEYMRSNFKYFFEVQFNRASAYQGITLHQAVFNLTSCPSLSLFHSREIWDELYQKVDLSSFNFSLFGNSPDLRKEIGNKLANKEIKWIKKNPTPLPWFINPLLKKNLLKMYIKKIESFLGN